MSTTYKELKKIEDGTQYPVIVEAAKKDSHGNDMDMNQKANVDGYYETFGYAREAGIAKNLQNDEGKLLDPDTATSSGTVYADQPFTQRATAMTMNAYLNNELISVGSGYEQWKKEQAFSIVRNQYRKAKTGANAGITWTLTADGTLTFSGTSIVGSEWSMNFIEDVIPKGHKCLFWCSKKSEYLKNWLAYNNNTRLIASGSNGIFELSNDSNDVGLSFQIPEGTTIPDNTIAATNVVIIDLTKWFASRPEIATALNGDAGIKWFLQNYPQATTLGYDEGTIVDTEDYEYQTTGVNLWDEQWEVGVYNPTNGEKLDNSIQIRSKNSIAVLPNTQYYIYLGSNSYIFSLFYDMDNNFITNVEDGNNYMTLRNKVFTTPSNAYSMRFYILQTYGTTYKHDIQICQHFTETSVEQTYHPSEIYKDRVSWAFTSTGKGKSAGKVADTKDYVNKKNIEKVGRVDLGTLDWTKGGTNFSAPFISVCGAKQPTNAQTPKLLCSKQMTPKSQDAISGNLGTFEAYITQGGYLCWYYTLEDFVDGNAFKTAMSGVILYYELATYIETDMTGDELDTNIPENDYGVERKVPLSGNMFSGSATTIFYQDNVLRQIYNNKTSVDNLQAKVNNIETRIPTAPTTDGVYVMTRSGGKNHYTSASTLEMTTDEYNQVIAALNGTN